MILKKVQALCDNNRYSALNEITRASSLNQLDYILVKRKLKENVFTTSYFNFISDHKTIIVRRGDNGNELKSDIKERLVFNREMHLKDMKNKRGRDEEDTSSSSFDKRKKLVSFKRKFKNVDVKTCWLNSCLQLLLCAFDYDDSLNWENSCSK